MASAFHLTTVYRPQPSLKTRQSYFNSKFCAPSVRSHRDHCPANWRPRELNTLSILLDSLNQRPAKLADTVSSLTSLGFVLNTLPNKLHIYLYIVGSTSPAHRSLSTPTSNPFSQPPTIAAYTQIHRNTARFVTPRNLLQHLNRLAPATLHHHLARSYSCHYPPSRPTTSAAACQMN